MDKDSVILEVCTPVEEWIKLDKVFVLLEEESVETGIELNKVSVLLEEESGIELDKDSVMLDICKPVE
jgi:hypothetical protein